MLYGTCRQTRKLGTGGLSYLSKIVFLTKRKRWGISNQRLLALEPSPYPPASDPLSHQEGQSQRTTSLSLRVPPAFPSLLPWVSSLCFSLHWLFSPLSASAHRFCPQFPSPGFKNLSQADDCSGKYRVPKTRTYWPSLGHIAAPGLIYESSRVAGRVPDPHKEGKQCLG